MLVPFGEMPWVLAEAEMTVNILLPKNSFCLNDISRDKLEAGKLEFLPGQVIASGSLSPYPSRIFGFQSLIGMLGIGWMLERGLE